MPRRRALALLALASALVATGCPDGGGGGRGGRGEQGASTTTAGSTAPRRGGVLRLALERPRSLDPAQARSVAEVMVADQLFDSLTAYPAGSTDVVPSLAAQWGAGPDLRDWDFVLRPGAMFHSGRPVTAADVKYSLERLARPGSGTHELLVHQQLEVVAGFRPFVDGGTPELAGITTPAPDVVRFRLDAPLASLPALLAHPAFGVVPREAVEAPAPPFGESPVGSGPFALGERDGDRVRLRRVPGSAALLDGMELRFTGDAGAAYALFRDGQVDWSPVAPEDAEAARERYGAGGFAPYLGEVFYGFNLRSPKFADPRFREAIVRGVDRRAVVAAVYGDSVTTLDALVPQGVAGHQGNACGERCRFDPTRARELVTQAFPAGPPEIAIDYDDDRAQAAVARALQAELAEVGIKATPRPHPFDRYDEVLAGGQQDLFRLGWIGAFPASDAFLFPLFLTGSGFNVTRFSAAAVDELLRAARAEPDAARRLALYQDAERRILDLVPILPLAQFQTRAVVAKRVRGLALNSVGSFDASLVWLAPPG